MNAPSTQSLLLIALPYVALALFVAGMIWRYRRPVTLSARSSQMLESRWLVWGAVPFHLGIAVLFAGHLLPVLFPAQWLAFVTNRDALLAVETIGAAAGLLCLLGLIVLFARRLGSRMVRRTSRRTDLLVLAILIAQVTVGLGVATMHRWGSVWSVQTTTPYLRGILTLRPDPALVAGVRPLVALHLAGAWIVLALLPFTRLIHMFAFPLGYLVRRPQKVVWMSARRGSRRGATGTAASEKAPSRRAEPRFAR